MPLFSDILDQKNIIEHMKKSVETGTISHGYIISGEKGMGKKLLADTYSMAIQCENDDQRPCLKCHSCKQALSRNHPDIKWVWHEKPGSISVEEVRAQIVNDIGIKPYSSDYKIYIVDDAEKMTVAAQNALLKTIEEPPAYGIIILLCKNREMLLDTIISRCVVLDVKPVLSSEIKNYLIRNCQVPDYKAEEITNFAMGNLGKAIDMAQSEEYENIRKIVTELLKDIENKSAVSINTAVKDIGTYKDKIDEVLDSMLLWFRDVLLYKSSGCDEKLMFAEYKENIKRQSQEYSFKNLDQVCKEIDRFKLRLASNVNFDIGLEVLLIKIRDLSR